MMSLLKLGLLDLEGFEVSGHIEFGGAQQLAVHTLIGGVRVIDALGRDDAPLEWSGVLTGSDAADRARTLDSLRVAGEVQTLIWDAFCYSVIIAKLHLEFHNPWWIPYKISCVIQRDLAQGIPSLFPSVSSSVISDLTSAQQFVGPILMTSIAAASALVASSTTGPAAAETTITAAQRSLESGIQEAQLGLQSNDIGQLVASAGSLAQLCCARGFLDRSMTNISGVGI